MTRTAFIQATVHTLPLNAEPGSTQPPLERAVLPGGPDRQHTARSERRVCARGTITVVQTGIRRRGHRDRAVIDVKEDDIKAAMARSQRGDDVTLLDAHPPVTQRMLSQRSERTPVPVHDSR